MINVYKILPKTTVEGPGTRFCIWVQGCSRHCDGCWAKETWDFKSGVKYSTEELFELIKSQTGIEGVTFLGGEPFEQAEELSVLAKKCKSAGLSVVCFSGFTYEELLNSKKIPYAKDLLAQIDLLIDGGFEKDKYDISRPWVGSANQNYIFLTGRYSLEEIMKYKNKIEVRIGENGKVEINGMGDFEQIKKDFCLQLGKNIIK